MTAREDAKAAGLTRYLGKVCSAHPEMNGERRVSDAHCVPCAVVRNLKRIKRQRSKGARYFGVICTKHPELEGERHVGGGCVACMALQRKEHRRQRTEKHSTSKYVGRICAEHPEAKGKRWTASDICVECFRLKQQAAYRKRREQHTGTTYLGRVCSKHPELYGKRWTSSNYCVECLRVKRRTIWKKPDRAIASIRTRILNALRRNSGKKAASTEELLGCSIEYLRQHLERQFLPGMSWENRAEWHVDHIRPLSSFDLSDPEQQRAAFHHTNLQPLWAKDNLTKHATWYGKAA